MLRRKSSIEADIYTHQLHCGIGLWPTTLPGYKATPSWRSARSNGFDAQGSATGRHHCGFTERTREKPCQPRLSLAETPCLTSFSLNCIVQGACEVAVWSKHMETNRGQQRRCSLEESKRNKYSVDILQKACSFRRQWLCLHPMAANAYVCRHNHGYPDCLPPSIILWLSSHLL